MNKSIHRLIPRGIRGGFSWFGNNLTVTTVLLAAVAVWCSGCGNDPNCDERGDYGICFAKEAQVSGVQYGDWKPDNGDVSANGSYVCAPSYSLANLGDWSGEIECLDPATEADEWESKDWGINLGIQLPSERCACASAYLNCDMAITVIFDQEVGIPRRGAIFDLTQARLVEPFYIADGADYAISGGTIEFVTVEAHQYSFKIHNLTLARIPGQVDAEPSNCYIPETVTIDSISISCVPDVWNIYC